MSVTKKSFGERAFLYVIENANGMTAVVSDLGAVLQSLRVPDKEGVLTDVVLGYDDVTSYENNPQSQGQIVGRFANRIGGAAFTLNGQTYQLDANEGKNVLHSGRKSYGIRLWSAEVGDDAVTFSLISPDGDQGLPGEAKISVRYSLSADNALHIQYCAVSDKDTYFNLTNHAYFNLAGHDSGCVGKQYVTLACSRFTPVDGELIPTGKVASVAGTPLDFTTAKPIARDIDKLECEQLRLGGGFDHNFVIDEPGLEKPFARCWSEETGIVMEAFTDMPAVQFYSGNFMGDVKGGKGGADYPKRGGFCLETQFYPDTPNKPDFPSCLFKAGEAFESETVYKFSVM
ncbi:MAG: galactose mutarotase [Oscillospiraceae bacterium]|jgi:aldose 1-epimerase|nr:galactose mutarotase [Oscillospiraceae bacterium]